MRNAVANLENKVGDALAAAGLASGTGADGNVSGNCLRQKILKIEHFI